MLDIGGVVIETQALDEGERLIYLHGGNPRLQDTFSDSAISRMGGTRVPA